MTLKVEKTLILISSPYTGPKCRRPLKLSKMSAPFEVKQSRHPALLSIPWLRSTKAPSYYTWLSSGAKKMEPRSYLFFFFFFFRKENLYVIYTDVRAMSRMRAGTPTGSWKSSEISIRKIRNLDFWGNGWPPKKKKPKSCYHHLKQAQNVGALWS